MAAHNFLKVDLTTGKIKEEAAIASSAGAGDDGKLVALDGTGKISSTMMPTGIGAEQVTITAAGTLSQYNLINIYLDEATVKGRKADGGTNKYPAHAWAIAAITDTETGIVQTNGIITGSGLTPGAEYFLDDTAGAYCLVAGIPSGTGKLFQKIGYAISETELVFEPEQDIELA